MKQDYAFDKVNFILIALGVAVVIIGLMLMSGSSSGEEFFNEEIFSARRIKLAPAVCLLGFVFMIYGVARKPRNKKEIE